MAKRVVNIRNKTNIDKSYFYSADQAHPTEPEFNPIEPANTTVAVGRSATLQCSGNSEVAPHIKVSRQHVSGSQAGKVSMMLT